MYALGWAAAAACKQIGRLQASTHPVQLTSGIVELVARLHARNVDVFLVSGGFRELIVPVARSLNIAESRIYANRFIFDCDSGAYVDFDRNEPTSASGGKSVGKARVLRDFKRKVSLAIQNEKIFGFEHCKRRSESKICKRKIAYFSPAQSAKLADSGIKISLWSATAQRTLRRDRRPTFLLASAAIKCATQFESRPVGAKVSGERAGEQKIYFEKLARARAL